MKWYTCSMVLWSSIAICASATIRTETWESGLLRGWICRDTVNERTVDALRVQDNALTLRFPAQSMKLPPEEYMLIADSQASDGAFTGDFFAIGARSISVRLRIEYPGAVSLVIGGDGKWWRCRLNGLTVGEWNDVTVSVDPDALVSLNSMDNATEFAAMLRNVEWIGILFRRYRTLAAYDCKIDSITLSAAGTGYGEWIEGFNGCDVDRLATRSLSPIGIPNYDAWIAGTPPDDPAAAFRVVSAFSDDGEEGRRVRLEWLFVAGREYRVWRADRVGEAYSAVSGWLSGTPGITSFEDHPTGETPIWIYKLQVRMGETVPDE